MASLGLIEVVPPGRWRITSALFGAQAAYTAAAVAALTVASIVGARLSGNSALAGVPVFALYLGRAASALPVGLLMDRIGRGPALAAGYTFGVIGAALAAFAVAAGSYAGFVAGAFLFGMARGGGEQARFVAAEVHSETGRARAIGLIVFSGTVGAVGGPMFVSVSSDIAAGFGINPLAGPWMLGAVLSLASAALVFAFVHRTPVALNARGSGTSALVERLEREGPARRMSEILASSQVRLALGAMIVGQVVMTMIMTITPLHMSDGNHGMQAISIAMMIHTLGMFGLSWATGRLVDRFGRYAAIAAGGAMLIAAGLLATGAQGLGELYVIMFLLGLGWNFAFVAGSSLLFDSIALAERGRTQGMAELLSSAVAGVSGLLAGLTFAAGGLPLLGVAGTGLAAGMALVASWVGAVRRRAAAAPS